MAETLHTIEHYKTESLFQQIWGNFLQIDA